MTRGAPIDFTELADEGVQTLAGWLAPHAHPAIWDGLREVPEGDPPFAWFERLFRDPNILDAVVSRLGPNVCVGGWRLIRIAGDDPPDAQVHQLQPYLGGGDRKLCIHLPLTPFETAPGMFAGSHRLGPLSMGPLDPSRFPAMRRVAAKLDVGDVLLSDGLTWRTLNAKPAGASGLLVEMVFQPAADLSSNILVAGKREHPVCLATRFDGSSVPSSRLNGRTAHARLRGGDGEGAKRLARGLLADDPDHVGAALILHEALCAEGVPSEAQRYLKAALEGLARLEAAVAVGGARADPAAVAAGPAPATWRPVNAAWRSSTAQAPKITESGVITMTTPDVAWAYGAVSAVLPLDRPCALRLRVGAVVGCVGIGLVSEDQSRLLAEEVRLDPGTDERVLILPFSPRVEPARLCVRNFGDSGRSGTIQLLSLDAFWEAGGAAGR